jgi:two-component system, NtrC family, sensor kinase
MTDCANILRNEAERIAAAATDAADADGFEAPVRDLVFCLARDLTTKEAIDTSPLREAGAEDALVGRLLRAIDAKCIESLRHGLGRGTCGTTVLKLRARIRQAIPRQPLEPWCAEMGQLLRQPPSDSIDQNERQLRIFFETVMSASHDMVYAHDVNGNLFHINETGLKLTKYALEDLFEGMSIYDFVVTEHVDLVEARLESPGAISRAPYSIEIFAKDGERIPIEIDTRPLCRDEGEVMAIVGVARDLRLERRLEREIHRSNLHLTSIIDNAPIGILTTNIHGEIQDANPTAASLCGFPDARAMLGKPSHELLLAFGNDGRVIRRAVTSALSSGTEIRARVSMRTQFGTTLNCDVILTPIRGASGEMEGLLILLVDVTEQLGLQQKLLQSEKMSALGQIVAGVAHELNNPLTGILGYAQYVLNVIDEPNLKSRVERVSEEAQRCKRLVQNLLAFAERGSAVRHPQDLNHLVEEALSLCGYELRVDDIEVVTDLEPGLPELEVAAQDIQRVILNLISNAHHALAGMEERSRKLTVRTATVDDAVHIVLEDNGPGIPPENRERVFEPFFSTLGVGEGLGLGLSVAYAIVRDHGGSLDLVSEPDRGTTLTISLPVSP